MCQTAPVVVGLFRRGPVADQFLDTGFRYLSFSRRSSLSSADSQHTSFRVEPPRTMSLAQHRSMAIVNLTSRIRSYGRRPVGFSGHGLRQGKPRLRKPRIQAAVVRVQRKCSGNASFKEIIRGHSERDFQSCRSPWIPGWQRPQSVQASKVADQRPPDAAHLVWHLLSDGLQAVHARTPSKFGGVNSTDHCRYDVLQSHPPPRPVQQGEGMVCDQTTLTLILLCSCSSQSRSLGPKAHRLVPTLWCIQFGQNQNNCTPTTPLHGCTLVILCVWALCFVADLPSLNNVQSPRIQLSRNVDAHGHPFFSTRCARAQAVEGNP